MLYNIHDIMVLGVFRVKEFISDVGLMIWTDFDLQNQDGRLFLAGKGSLNFSYDSTYYSKQYVVFGAQKFIYDVVLVIWHAFDLIKDSR